MHPPQAVVHSCTNILDSAQGQRKHVASPLMQVAQTQDALGRVTSKNLSEHMKLGGGTAC